MLTGSGLRYYSLLAHASTQEGLAQGVVDLVRSGVIEILPLEVNLWSTVLTAGGSAE